MCCVLVHTGGSWRLLLLGVVTHYLRSRLLSLQTIAFIDHCHKQPEIKTVPTKEVHVGLSPDWHPTGDREPTASRQMVNTQSTFHTRSTDGQHGQQTVNSAPERFPVDELGVSPRA